MRRASTVIYTYMTAHIGEPARVAENGSLLPCILLILRIRHLNLRTRVISWSYSRTRPHTLSWWNFFGLKFPGIASRWSKTPSRALLEVLIAFQISASQMTATETISTDRSQHCCVTAALLHVTRFVYLRYWDISPSLSKQLCLCALALQHPILQHLRDTASLPLITLRHISSSTQEAMKQARD